MSEPCRLEGLYSSSMSLILTASWHIHNIYILPYKHISPGQKERMREREEEVRTRTTIHKHFDDNDDDDKKNTQAHTLYPLCTAYAIRLLARSLASSSRLNEFFYYCEAQRRGRDTSIRSLPSERRRKNVATEFISLFIKKTTIKKLWPLKFVFVLYNVFIYEYRQTPARKKYHNYVN